MPQLGSPVSTPAGMPAVNPAHVGKLAGAVLHFPSFVAFTAAITSGQTGFASDLWATGQRMTISGEPPSAIRMWNGTHARTVMVGMQSFVLAADTNTVLTEASGGNDGDLAIVEANATVFKNVGGTWSAGQSLATGLELIDFANPVPHNRPSQLMADVEVTSNITLTPDTTGAVRLNMTIGYFNGDGSHTVTMGAGYRASTSDAGFDPTKRNMLQSWTDGSSNVRYAWSQ